jgi:hypothetical protein
MGLLGASKGVLGCFNGFHGRCSWCSRRRGFFKNQTAPKKLVPTLSNQDLSKVLNEILSYLNGNYLI